MCDTCGGLFPCVAAQKIKDGINFQPVPCFLLTCLILREHLVSTILFCESCVASKWKQWFGWWKQALSFCRFWVITSGSVVFGLQNNLIMDWFAFWYLNSKSREFYWGVVSLTISCFCKQLILFCKQQSFQINGVILTNRITLIYSCSF